MGGALVRQRARGAQPGEAAEGTGGDDSATAEETTEEDSSEEG